MAEASITHFTPDDLPPISQELKLSCQKCGRPGIYDVGRILWSEEGAPPKIVYAFSGYFRCTGCGSGGPWEIQDQLKLASLMFRARLNKQFDGLVNGRYCLFDGTFIQTVAMGEDYLLDLLLKEPANAFLHTRLGNLFRGCGQRARAVEWYEKALKRDPGDVEARYHLFCFAEEDEDIQRAANQARLLVKHLLAGRTTSKPDLTVGLAQYVVSRLRNAPELFREHFREPPPERADDKEDRFIRTLLALQGDEEEIANDAAHRLLEGKAEPSRVLGQTGAGEAFEPMDLVPVGSLDKVLKAEKWDVEKLRVALLADQHRHIRVQDRHSVPLTEGEKIVFWPVSSLRELFRGNRAPPPDMDHYPPDYCPHFFFIESHFLALCKAQGDRPDQEIEEIYSMLRRRPEGRSLGPAHDFLWQVAALLLGTHVLSQAEFESIFAALERSTRKWALRPISRNYAAYLRNNLSLG